MDRAIEVIRARYHRWARVRWREILNATRDDILASDDPSEAVFIAAVMRHDREARRVSDALVSQVYRATASLVYPDDVIKAWAPWEVKAVDRRIQELVQRLVGEDIGLIDDTTLRYVREAYVKAEGDVEKFRQLLKASPAFSPARARTIAVTETNRCINDSMYRTAEQVAGEREIETLWRTTLRLNVRPTHQMMEGKTVPHGVCFEVPTVDGGIDLMLYPGDTSHGASPGNIINCYCKGFSRYVQRFVI